MSYGDYVEQLTYLPFLKMANERTRVPYHQRSLMPEKCSWPRALTRTLSRRERENFMMATAFVHQRVAAGGHNVPEDVIRRRFYAGLGNFNQIYKPLVDEWVVYDNSGDEPVRSEEGYRP